MMICEFTTNILIMKKRITTILWMLMITAVIAAQKDAGETFTVKGVVADSLSRDGEAYATVRVARTSEPDTALLTLLTDAAGRFKAKVGGVGDITVTVASMGRRPLVRDFTAAAGETVELDTLFMVSADNELQQLVVTARKPLVKADIDKLTYSIEDDPDSESSTVLEMLRKVPMVTVDGEDEIKVNGSSSFKVYVNGRPNKMMSDNPKDVLKSLPANSVKKIEVITNPGPKYDAEGVGGILNIITTGNGPEGYTATLSANAANDGFGGGVFGTVKKGGLTVSARYNYTYKDMPPFMSESMRTVTGDVSEASSDLRAVTVNRLEYGMHSGSLEASYEIDTLRLVSAEFGLWGRDDTESHSSVTSGLMPGTAAELYGYDTEMRGTESFFSINGGVDYQRLFAGVKDRMFTLSYRISTSPNSSDSYYDYSDMRSAADWQDFLMRMKEQHNIKEQASTEHTFQADFTTPVGKIHTVEAGVKYIIRTNTAEDDRYERDAAAGGEYLPDTDHSSHYRHRNGIAAAYAGYGMKTGKWSGRLGLRYEHTAQTVEYLLGRGEDFSKDFDDLVPSASVGLQLTPVSNLRLGYNMRISRPGIWFLNPYLDDSNPTYIEQGNPELTSEKTHRVELGYSNFTQKFNVNLLADCSFTDNSIESVTELVPDETLAGKGLRNPTGKDVIYSTYYNIGKLHRFGLNGYASWNITSSTRINTNMYGCYSYLSDGRGLSNDGWFLSVYGEAQQTLPKEWRLSARVYYSTPWIMLQGTGNKWLDYGANVSKSFVGGRLTLSAFANNFFKKYFHTGYTEQSASFRSTTSFRAELMHYGMSVSFRIGELNADVKKAGRTINNDDIKETSGNGNGGK